MSIFLETERLIIKTPSLEYLHEAFLLDSDPNVMYFMGGPRTLESTREWLEKNIRHQERNGFGFGLVFEKETSQFIGRAGLLYLAYDENQTDIEIGYRLHEVFWGKGYATELVKALIKWGFENLSVNKLVAVIKPDNHRSRNVLEKSGLCYVGKSKYYDDEVDRYEISKHIIMG
jgi:[ribosomal protein S5]-alanine N-acetyltransferase